MLAILASLLIGSAPAAAQIVIGAPSTAPGGGWSCSGATAGNEKLAGGTTWTCSGAAGAFSNLYLGINRLTSVPFGEKMNSTGGSEPSGVERVVWSVNGATFVRYTGSTSMPGFGSTIFTRVTLTFTGTGSVVDDATTQALTGTNINGSVHALWHIDSSVSAMTVNVLVEASTSSSSGFVPARTFFGTTGAHRQGTGVNLTDQDRSHVDIAFYTSSCGDGTADMNFGAEDCDQGGANGTASSCCTSSCQFKAGPGINVCRSSAGVCDVQETCTGASGTCPADSFASASTSCTGASQGGVCDDDAADHCTGTNATTCVDVFQSASTVCRASAGQCDVAENCTGSSGACPVDAFQSASTNCTGTSQGGTCDDDAADHCTGANATTCVDVFQSASTVCRGSAGQCDVAENCTGSSGACPVDAFQSASTSCTGASQGGVCDDDASDHCTGTSNACVDVFEPGSTVCRASAGQCDVAENCTGSSGACPADTKVGSGTVCRSAAGVCDIAEACDGSGDDCPADVFVSSSTVCRSAAGVCDVAESCTGSAAACPGDAVESSSTVCRSSAGICDVVENCTGSDVDCPADSVAGAFVVCRSAVDECDAPDTCDGSTVTCPADGKQPVNTACTADSNVCTLDICDGVGDACTHPAGNAGATCRAAAGVCDLAETCDGSSTACPADAKAPTSTPCRASAGFCDMAENCDGTNDACPADVFQPSSTVCRSAAGVCDVAENCTGSSANCPGDTFAPTSTVCRSAAGVCDLAESCTGSGPACPADDFKPSSTVCRSAVGACDIAEQCTGSGADCPADAVSPDTDGDTVCDAIDDCPDVPDPAQIDSDNDGAGDACDLCTNTLPSYADRAKVTVGRLNTPPGDDTAKIKGRCIPFQEAPAIDPLTNGVRLVMQDNSGGTPMDVTLPGGAYSTVTKAGWKVHTFPTGMTAQYKNAGTVVPLINGIKKLKFVIKSGQGITKFSAVGKNGSYPIAPGDEPVKVTFVADPPYAMNGQCCEMTFPGPAPTVPSCAFNASGSTLRCK